MVYMTVKVRAIATYPINALRVNIPHICPEGHLPHAVGVEVELVVHYVYKVLQRSKYGGQRSKPKSTHTNYVKQVGQSHCIYI